MPVARCDQGRNRPAPRCEVGNDFPLRRDGPDLGDDLLQDRCQRLVASRLECQTPAQASAREVEQVGDQRIGAFEASAHLADDLVTAFAQ